MGEATGSLGALGSSDWQSIALVVERIEGAIARLGQLTRLDIQDRWHGCGEDLAIAEGTSSALWDQWPLVQPNSKQHIAWSRGKQVLWLGQRFLIPEQLQGYSLAGLGMRLALTWWAEQAEVFVNGQRVQGGDLFDCVTRINVCAVAEPGQAIALAVRLVSPGHDEGALVRAHVQFEGLSGPESGGEENSIDPGFIADELTVILHYLKTFQPNELPKLSALIETLDWSRVGDRPLFDQALETLRQTLPWGEWIKQRQITLVGHAHLDLAWLWPVVETWEAAERTFRSVLALQKEFPELIFTHSTPALYQWIEENRPDLFLEIQQSVKQGHWDVAAGLWIEPDLNLPSGEAIARHILYGQQYVQEKFGQLSTIAWLPDTFGFNWQLPQLLSLGNIRYFLTEKLRWNDTTQFPHGFFWWRSPDGSEILSLTLPPIGTQVNPVQMAEYACQWEVKTGLQHTLWLPGVGDHGGGPTRDMLETARRWGRSPFFPKLAFQSAHQFLQTLEVSLGSDLENLPVWEDELYLEFHRGCYTTHAHQKQWNRRLENALYIAELLSSIATLKTGCTYPKKELETTWKTLLFNQFHDILPGTSIPQVFVDANQAWETVEHQSQELIERAIAQLFNQIQLSPPPRPNAKPIFIFNPLSWNATDLITIPCLKKWVQQRTTHSDNKDGIRNQIKGGIRVFDSEGREITIQLEQDSNHSSEKFSEEFSEISLHFVVNNIPAFGYGLYWVCFPETDEKHSSHSPTDESDIKYHVEHRAEDNINQNFVLENDDLQVTIDPETGDLTRVFDKNHHRDVLNGPGNQLQAFQDQGQYWDAWNIDPNYENHPLPPAQLKSIQWQANGPLIQSIRVERLIGQSVFIQTYYLKIHSPILWIKTTVDWQERQTLVKAAFPLAIDADAVSYEIPCGVIQRPTRPQNDHEKAKWEVPAQRWADLTSTTVNADLTSTTANENLTSTLTSPPTSATANPDNYGTQPDHSHANSSANSDYGVSLLNDSKYGYDCSPNQLRLTLLRSPIWPDPEADQGIHSFTYGLYPHVGSWQDAQTVMYASRLNTGLVHQIFDPWQAESDFKSKPQSKPKINSLIPGESFLSLGSQNLALMAFKQSESDPNSWVLRCYECHGKNAQLKLENSLKLAIAHPINLLEIPLSEEDHSSKENPQTIHHNTNDKSSQESPSPLHQNITPWQIASFKLIQQGVEQPQHPVSA